MKQRSGFFTFVGSIIPGIGYIYLGLVKKGIQAFLLFFLIDDLLRMVGLGGFAWLIQLPLWFYVFFDTHNIANRIDRGEMVLDSDFFFEKYTHGNNNDQNYGNYNNNMNNENPSENFSHMNFEKHPSIHMDKKKMTAIAGILISLGVLGILNQAFEGSAIYYQIREGITQYFVPVLFIVGGIFLLRKKS